MKLKTYLKLFKISNLDFSKKIGISSVSLSRYISGERIPEKSILNKIFKLTDGLVDANDFFLESDPSRDLSEIYKVFRVYSLTVPRVNPLTKCFLTIKIIINTGIIEIVVKAAIISQLGIVFIIEA